MFFILFSIEFVANHALLEALNLSRITHFWCKFLCPKKAAGVNVLTYSNSVLIVFLLLLLSIVYYTSPEHYHCQSISTPSSSITLTRTLSSCTEHYQIWTEHLQTIVFCRALSNDSVLSKPDSVLCKPESVLVQLDRVLAW